MVVLLTCSPRTQAYITGNAFTVLTGPQTVVQTVYADTDDALEAIDIDEESGRIATCTRTRIAIYNPRSQDRRTALKVCPLPSAPRMVKRTHRTGALTEPWSTVGARVNHHHRGGWPDLFDPRIILGRVPGSSAWSARARPLLRPRCAHPRLVQRRPESRLNRGAFI